MPANNPAQQFLDQPKSQVGAYALNLASLATKDIPLPVSFCLPVSGLQAIAQHNQLPKQFAQITQSLDPSHQLQVEQAVRAVRQLIRQQAIPESVADKLFSFYQQHLQRDFIRLIASPVRGFDTDYKRENNIKGEANMIESILTLWARNVGQYQLLQQQLHPVAIVIQAQSQPQSSGLAYTQHPQTGDKTRFVIKSRWGVYAPDEFNPESGEALTDSIPTGQDQFIVDQHSWKVVQQDIQPQKQLLQRRLDQLQLKTVGKEKVQAPSLSPEQVVELSKLIKRIKLNHVKQLRIHWSLRQEQLVITKIKPYNFKLPKQKQGSRPKTLALGQGLTSGYLSGLAQVVTNKTELANFDTGRIAVCKKLTPENQALIQTASAIVCQQGITNQHLVGKIKHYQLPTITHAQHILQRVKTGQEIIVDVAAGKVYQRQTHNHNQAKNQHIPAHIPTKLYLAVNQPDEVSSEISALSHGLGLIRSDHFYIKTGQHPKLLINKQKEQLKQQIAQQITNYYHRFINLTERSPQLIWRSMNLTTRQLAKLKTTAQYEQTGPNPFLGFRGGIRQLNQPQIFDFELETIQYINRQLDQPLALLLPFMRNSFELQQVLHYLERKIKPEVLTPQIWLQINTPENLLNLDQYLRTNLSGVIVNVKTIHALLHGIDPNLPEVFQVYQPDNQLLSQLIEQAHHKLQDRPKQIKFMLNLFQFNQDLLDLAVRLKLDGVVVRPDLAAQTKQAIINAY
jgi:phosphoenolpyruvate synthase/pyruvate phosphate dikinase